MGGRPPTAGRNSREAPKPRVLLPMPPYTLPTSGTCTIDAMMSRARSPPLPHGGDGDEPVVVHVNLGAGLLLNRPDRLSLGSDDVADLVRRDLDRDDARRVLGELRARLRHRPIHDIEDVHTGLLRPVERFRDD